MDPFAFDASFRDRRGAVIAGVDEAGRGPLAGPVVAAAVILPEDFRDEGIRDSKRIPEKEREALFEVVLSGARAVGVGIVESEEIDATNILRATQRAMSVALERLSVAPDLVLLDAVTLPDVYLTQVPLVKGDAKSAAIAAASIIAKVTRDRLMLGWHKKYPLYGFDQHKGYGTKEHIERIRTYGPCPIHRRSFHQVMTQELPF